MVKFQRAIQLTICVLFAIALTLTIWMLALVLKTPEGRKKEMVRL
jgi:hypothetical protein